MRVDTHTLASVPGTLVPLLPMGKTLLFPTVTPVRVREGTCECEYVRVCVCVCECVYV